jgi:hypothetical protein
MSKVYKSPVFQDGKAIDDALSKALTAVQDDMPADGKQYARVNQSDGTKLWSLAGRGEPGKSAYELAVENGQPNTQNEIIWLKSLKGDNAFETLKDAEVIPPEYTEEDWNDSLKGEPGAQYAILKTYYFRTGAAYSLTNILSSGATDFFGNVFVIDSDRHSNETLLISLDGAVIRPRNQGEQAGFWRINLDLDQIEFDPVLPEDGILTVTDLMPAELAQPGSGTYGVLPPYAEARLKQLVYAWFPDGESQGWREAFATEEEVLAGTADDRSISPAVLQSRIVNTPSVTPADDHNHLVGLNENGVIANGFIPFKPLSYFGTLDVTVAYSVPAEDPEIGSFGIVQHTGTADASWAAVGITGDFDAGDMLIWNGIGFDAVEQEGEYATAAQGALADTALQPEDVGTAAYNATGDFATAAQGALADTAVQPGDLGTAADNDEGDFATAAQGALADTAVQNVQGVTGIWQGTQAEYDALTPDPNTLYFIV